MSALARLPRSRGDRLYDVEHSHDEESSPNDGSYLIFIEGCTLCDWLRDSVCHLLAPALQSCLSELSRIRHVRLLVVAGSVLPVPGCSGLTLTTVLLAWARVRRNATIRTTAVGGRAKANRGPVNKSQNAMAGIATRRIKMPSVR